MSSYSLRRERSYLSTVSSSSTRSRRRPATVVARSGSSVRVTSSCSVSTSPVQTTSARRGESRSRQSNPFGPRFTQGGEASASSAMPRRTMTCASRRSCMPDLLGREEPSQACPGKTRDGACSPSPRARGMDARRVVETGCIRVASAAREPGLKRSPLVAVLPAAPCSAAYGGLPPTSTDAVRLAIKIAVDAGEYDRAAALLEVLSRHET